MIGWSCAWHLLSRQPKLRLVVIDPDASRCTSHRGAGGSRAQFSTAVNIALSLLSIEEFKRFPSDIGFDIGYRQHGYLLFTAQPDRAQKMMEAAAFQRNHGVQIQDLTVEELKARVPCLNTSDLVHAQIGLQDGYMDGPQVQRAYRSGSVSMGAEEIHQQATCISAKQVEAESGVIAAEHVIVTTGHWSGTLGLNLSVKPEKHQLFFDSPPMVDPLWPFTIDADTTFHFRPDGDDILVCFNDLELASVERNPDETPHFEDDVLNRLLPLADHRAPGMIERDRIERGRAGYYAVTPDRHPIIGVKDGICIATGFGGHGVMHSPAAGKLIAEMLLDGSAKSVDVSSLNPDRFERGELIKETMVF